MKMGIKEIDIENTNRRGWMGFVFLVLSLLIMSTKGHAGGLQQQPPQNLNKITLTKFYAADNMTRLLKTKKLVLAQSGGGSCTPNSLFLDPTGQLSICNEAGEEEDIDGVWSHNETTGNLYLTDPDPNVFVGIGTTDPILKLHLAQDGGILAMGQKDQGVTLSSSLAGSTAFLWYPRKAARWVGLSSSVPIDDSLIGAWSVVAGGIDNIAYGNYSSTGGGNLNNSNYNYSTIGGGYFNWNRGEYASISGGEHNIIAKAVGLPLHASISGGKRNANNADYSTIGGGGYNVIGEGTYNTIKGGYLNEIGSSCIPPESLVVNSGTILGGTRHRLCYDYGAIGGGDFNRVDGVYSTIIGGQNNNTNQRFAFMGGGSSNVISGFSYSSIAGGIGNSVNGGYSTISGGRDNLLNGDLSVIAGGGPDAIGVSSQILDSDFAVISGGRKNMIRGHFALIAGGENNTANLMRDAVLGGLGNLAQGDTALAGGMNNQALKLESAALGGQLNVADGAYSFIGGGYQNRTTSTYSAILGGEGNKADQFAGVLAGRNNTASGYESIILGGENLTVSGTDSIAAGRRLNVTGSRTFAWGHPAMVQTISANDAFIIATGYVGIGLDNPSARLAIVGPMRADLAAVPAGIMDSSDPAVGWDVGSQTLYYGFDVAELFDSSEEVEIAEVLVIDSVRPLKLRRSRSPYEKGTVGVVSGAPAILFEGKDLYIAPQPFQFQKGLKPPVALSGRIPCKVTLENGPIERGDFLTTSSVPGHAMKATDRERSFGTVIGKALTPFNGGENGETEGVVLLFATLQ